jgi:large subunit ribosomal protein L5e
MAFLLHRLLATPLACSLLAVLSRSSASTRSTLARFVKPQNNSRFCRAVEPLLPYLFPDEFIPLILQEEVDGEDYQVEEAEDKARPFSVCLDVGLATTSTGARVFGALKGALDGGLLIPHSVRRWPAAEKDAIDAELRKYIFFVCVCTVYWLDGMRVCGHCHASRTLLDVVPDMINACAVRKYIFCGHVQEYMEYLEDEDEETYKTCFAKYIEADVTAENMEETWTNVHKQIRAKPEQVLTKKTEGRKMKSKKKSKLSAPQRQDRVAQKIAAHVKKLSNA